MAFLVDREISPYTIKGNPLNEGCKDVRPFPNHNHSKGYRRWKLLRMFVDMAKDLHFGRVIGFINLDNCVRRYANNGSYGVLVE